MCGRGGLRAPFVCGSARPGLAGSSAATRVPDALLCRSADSAVVSWLHRRVASIRAFSGVVHRKQQRKTQRVGVNARRPLSPRSSACGAGSIEVRRVLSSLCVQNRRSTPQPKRVGSPRCVSFILWVAFAAMSISPSNGNQAAVSLCVCKSSFTTRRPHAKASPRCVVRARRCAFLPSSPTRLAHALHLDIDVQPSQGGLVRYVDWMRKLRSPAAVVNSASGTSVVSAPVVLPAAIRVTT